MKNYDRVSIVVSLVLLGLVMSQLISLPTRLLEATVFGTPVSIALSTQLILGLLLSFLTATGVEYVMRGHPLVDERRRGPMIGLWILPMLITLAAARLTPLLLARGIGTWVLGLIVVGILLAAMIVAEYRTLDPAAPGATAARFVTSGATYVAALVLFAATYGAKARSLLSASMVVVFATLLALVILRIRSDTERSSWGYALLCGLLLGEATWALNYWGVSGLTGGALLLLLFYLFTGLSQQHLLGRFNARVLAEYGIITALGVLLLATQGVFSW